MAVSKIKALQYVVLNLLILSSFESTASDGPTALVCKGNFSVFGDQRTEGAYTTVIRVDLQNRRVDILGSFAHGTFNFSERSNDEQITFHGDQRTFGSINRYSGELIMNELREDGGANWIVNASCTLTERVF